MPTRNIRDVNEKELQINYRNDKSATLIDEGFTIDLIDGNKETIPLEKIKGFYNTPDHYLYLAKRRNGQTIKSGDLNLGSYNSRLEMKIERFLESANEKLSSK